MFDILVSFGLGTLLGVFLTLLMLSIKNRRKGMSSDLGNASTGTVNLTLVEGEGQYDELDAVKSKEQESSSRATVGSDFDELEGFVRLDGTPTEYPVFETKIPAEEIEAIQNVVPSKEHLENEWIEAERVEAARSESELL